VLRDIAHFYGSTKKFIYYHSMKNILYWPHCCISIVVCWFIFEMSVVVVVFCWRFSIYLLNHLKWKILLFWFLFYSFSIFECLLLFICIDNSLTVNNIKLSKESKYFYIIFFMFRMQCMIFYYNITYSFYLFICLVLNGQCPDAIKLTLQPLQYIK
jgi:hypothetical protein